MNDKHEIGCICKVKKPVDNCLQSSGFCLRKTQPVVPTAQLPLSPLHVLNREKYIPAAPKSCRLGIVGCLADEVLSAPVPTGGGAGGLAFSIKALEFRNFRQRVR